MIPGWCEWPNAKKGLEYGISDLVDFRSLKTSTALIGSVESAWGDVVDGLLKSRPLCPRPRHLDQTTEDETVERDVPIPQGGKSYSPVPSIVKSNCLAPSRKAAGEIISIYLASHDNISQEELIHQFGKSHRDVFFAIKAERRWVRRESYLRLAKTIGCAPEDLYPVNKQPCPKWFRKLKQNQTTP
jgi:hypothetical protein